MLRGDKLAAALFAVFVLAYGIEKYVVAMPPTFDWGYARTVAVIVLLTAILPFAIIWLLRKRFQSFPVHAAIMTGLGVALSALGYAAFWYFTVSAFPGAPPVEALALRGIRPGLLMGAILVIGRWKS